MYKLCQLLTVYSQKESFSLLSNLFLRLREKNDLSLERRAEK